MSYRFMRIIVFFDLPMETSSDRREYTRFRKHLIKSGFVMMQESVYTKIALNATAAKLISDDVKKNKPAKGLVQMLIVTENQFNNMEFLVGDSKTDVITSDERLLIL